MLDLSLTNGFMPIDGELFVILISRGLSGTFLDNNIQIGNVTFTVEYSPSGFPNEVVLDAHVSVVPEPSALVMFVLGLAGMGALFSLQSSAGARRIIPSPSFQGGDTTASIPRGIDAVVLRNHG